MHAYLVTFAKADLYAFVEEVLTRESGNARDGPSAAQTTALIASLLNQWRQKRGVNDVIVDDADK